MSFSDYCFRMLVHQNREHISKVLRNSPWQNNVNSESSSLPWRTHTQPSFPRQQQMQIHWQTYYFCAAQSICTHHFHIYASHSACVNDLMETSATDTRRLQHKGLRQLRTPTHVFFTALTRCAKLEYSFVGSWGPAHEKYIYDTYTNIGNASISLVPAAK